MNTILVVDSTNSIYHQLSNCLKEEYELLKADTLSEGLHIIKNHTVNIVIIDSLLRSDEMFRFINEIRSDEAFRNILIFVVTERENMAEISALKSGVDDFINEPFDFHVICHKFDLAKARKNTLFQMNHKMKYEKIESDSENQYNLWSSNIAQINPDVVGIVKICIDTNKAEQGTGISKLFKKEFHFPMPYTDILKK